MLTPPKAVLLRKLSTAFRLAINAYWEYKPLFTTRGLSTSLDDIAVERPIFLLGTQGCGLTLLTRMLHRHEDIVTVGGGRAFWVGNNEMDKQYIGALPESFVLRSPGYRSPVFKKHMRGTEYEHPVFGNERNWVYACDDLANQYRKTEEDWSREEEVALKTAIKESIRAYAADVKAARFLDMSQTFALKVPLLRKIFPDAAFVVQTRNPYAVCFKEALDNSYAWRRKTSMSKKLRLFSEQWYNTYAYAFADLEKAKSTVFVSYEGLVKNPRKVLTDVTHTLGLDFSEDMLPQERHTLPMGAGERHKWFPIKEGLNEKYLSRIGRNHALEIKEKVEPLASKLGYPCPYAGVRHSAEARRRARRKLTTYGKESYSRGRK